MALPPKLSLVIPVYNPDSDFGARLDRVAQFLERTVAPFEIIVVDDGHTHRPITFDTPPWHHARITGIRLPKNRGKFGALKAGMALTQGTCCVFTDADIPYDLAALPYIVSLVNERGFHVVVGDRFVPESHYTSNGSVVRVGVSRLFRLLVRTLIAGGLSDTQCGLKGFSGSVARALFPLLCEERFAGDVELLYVALKYNLEIKRIPVRLQRSGASSVRLPRDALRMFVALLKLRGRWLRRRYESDALRETASQKYWENVAFAFHQDSDDSPAVLH